MQRACPRKFTVLLFICLASFMYLCVPKNAQARHCAAIIYEHANYRGAAQCLQVGHYNVEDLEIGNDTLSSIKVRRGNRVILFQHRDYSGRKGVVRKNISFVGDRWNDIVSSIIVK